MEKHITDTEWNTYIEWLEMVDESNASDRDTAEDHCGDDRCENGFVTVGNRLAADGTVEDYGFDCPICGAKDTGIIF